MTQWGLDTLFNPAKRHMDEEKQRLQSTREEVGDNSGGKRIDFESGKVTIRRASTDEDSPTDDDENSTEGGESAGGGAPKPNVAEKAAHASGDKSSSQPSPAAVRAAERRGRRPR